jgi:hypothetical protein
MDKDVHLLTVYPGQGAYNDVSHHAPEGNGQAAFVREGKTRHEPPDRHGEEEKRHADLRNTEEINRLIAMNIEAISEISIPSKQDLEVSEVDTVIEVLEVDTVTAVGNENMNADMNTDASTSTRSATDEAKMITCYLIDSAFYKIVEGALKDLDKSTSWHRPLDLPHELMVKWGYGIGYPDLFWNALEAKARHWIKRRVGSWQAHKLIGKIVDIALERAQDQLRHAGLGHFDYMTLLDTVKWALPKHLGGL